jgi:hypothetical protein
MPIPSLKPDGELLVSATSIALVLAIYSSTAPAYADIRADEPNNANTHASTKMAAITSTAAVGALALLGKSPTVATVGFATILFETWKRHYANYGVNGNAQNSVAQA